MADGSSGLSLSEMGISTVKKTANAVKKQATPFAQGIKQQITGQSPPPQIPANQNPSSQPPQEGITAGVFDLFKQVGKQVTGAGNQTSGQSTIQQSSQTAPKPAQQSGAQIPAGTQDRKVPEMSGTFDLSQLSNNQNIFEAGKSTQFPGTNNSQHKEPIPFTTQQAAKKEEPDKKQKIEDLRKKLHDAYFEEFTQKTEGKDKKEENVQERLEREEQEKQQKVMLEQEEEQKKAPIVPLSIKGRQGAHEGLKQKG